MFKRILLLSVVALATLASGCGDTEHVSAVNYYTNVIGNGLSGQTGTVVMNTTAQTQVLGQTVSVIESSTVPTVVDQFRVTGYGADGVAVYGPVLKAKATSTTLEGVPVEVKTLGVELLVDGLSIGGATVPITVTSGQTTTVSNFTFVITAGGNGATGPAGPSGPTGPVGPPGTGGTAETAYGSFADVGQFPTGESGNYVSFPFTFAAVGVSALPETEAFPEGALVQVDAEGDYLITYNITIGPSNSTFADFFFEVRTPDDQGEFDPQANDGRYYFGLDHTSRAQQSAQIVASLSAGQAFTLSFGVPLNQVSVSVVRLGASTNRPLPDPSGVNGGGVSF